MMNFNILPLLISFAAGLGVFFVQQFVRPQLARHGIHSILLDCAPNLIIGFCFPFCALIRPTLFTLKKAGKIFLLACIGTLLLLIVFEIKRPFEGAETFDYVDILASFTGIGAAYLFYRLWLERKLTFEDA